MNEDYGFSNLRYCSIVITLPRGMDANAVFLTCMFIFSYFTPLLRSNMAAFISFIDWRGSRM